MNYIKGFTLIELMVVLLIIAISGTVVTLNIPDNDQKTYQHSVENLIQTLNISHEYAVSQQKNVIIEFHKNGYIVKNIENSFVQITSLENYTNNNLNWSTDRPMLIVEHEPVFNMEPLKIFSNENSVVIKKDENGFFYEK